MTKRLRSVAAAFRYGQDQWFYLGPDLGLGLWLLGVAIASVIVAPVPADAQSADLVLCDRVAADPSDPDKPADVKGVDRVASSDVSTAIKFCKTASDGSRRAAYQLGRAYAAAQQMPAAIAAFRKAADKGSTSAMIELGTLYASGSGVPKDESQARKYFERAAAAGNAHGATSLMMLSGSNASDLAQARAMLAKAADANSAEAQFQLGLMLAQGVGGPQDDPGARALFEKAAEQNHAAALDWLGSFTASGRGGPQDKEAAKGYYARAVALGNEDAKVQLERLKCPMVLTTKKGEVLSHLCF